MLKSEKDTETLVCACLYKHPDRNGNKWDSDVICNYLSIYNHIYGCN
jgi:hypothetical protein